MAKTGQMDHALVLFTDYKNSLWKLAWYNLFTHDIKHWGAGGIRLLTILNKSDGHVPDSGPLLHNQKGSNNTASELPENTKMLLWSNGLDFASLLFAKNNIHVWF